MRFIRHTISRKRAIDWYTDEQSQFINVDGISVHYKVRGQGETIVLVHGFASSLTSWDIYASELAKHYQVVSVDLPGFGLTPFFDHSQPPRLVDYIYFLKDFTDALELDFFHLVGSSFGGWLAWEFAVHFPERVHKLTLMNAAGYFNQDTKSHTARLANNRVISQIVRLGIPRLLVRSVLRSCFGDQTKITSEIVQRYYEMVNVDGNPQTLLSLVKRMSIIDPDPEKVKNVQAPTLIIWGARDRIINVSNAFYFHEDINASQLLIYREAGHLPMEELPVKSATDTIEFLRKDHINSREPIMKKVS